MPPPGLDGAPHSMEASGEPSPWFFGTQSTNHRIRWNQKILYVADKEKTFGDASVPVQAITVEEGSILSDQSKIQSVASFLVIQGFVQAMQAKCHAFPYFSYVDNLAREVLNNRLGKQEPKKAGQ